MADISPERKNIQVEEIAFRAAVSEAAGYRMGAAINFINQRQHSEKQFFLNGRYGIVSPPTLGVDGLIVFEFDAIIFNVIMFNLVKGSGGTTELDLKKCSTPGGSFASIFGVTPKISSAAANNVWIGIGGSVTGCTAPVFDTGANLVNAGDALRCDVLGVQSGNPENCGLIVHYRPR